MSDEDNNFDGSLILDFRKWWSHVQPKNNYNQKQNHNQLQLGHAHIVTHIFPRFVQSHVCALMVAYVSHDQPL